MARSVPVTSDEPPSDGPEARATEADLETAASERSSAQGQFTLFSFLLAVAILLHEVQLGEWALLTPHAVLILSALWAVLKPSSLGRFLFMMVMQVAIVVIDMPGATGVSVANHWLLLGLSALVILVCAGFGAVTGRSWLSSGGDLYRVMAPLLRIQVVLVYAFAVLAKLNPAFFDAQLSCAVTMAGDVLSLVPLLPEGTWHAQPSIWGTIFVEAAIPLLLLFRRTRLLAVLIGGPFHTTLAVAGHVPFSGFAMAYYALFLPDDMPARLRRAVEDYPWLSRAAASAAATARRPLAFPVLAMGWLLMVAAHELDEGGIWSTIRGPGLKAVFLVYAAGLGLLLALCLLQRSRLQYRPGAFRLAHPIWLLGPILLVANGLSPYLGLKTQHSFTMYSNVKTEANLWNHAFMPEGMRVFGFQDETVRVIRSSDEDLQKLAARRSAMNPFDFRRELRENPDASVTYDYRGERIALAQARDDPALLQSSALPVEKLFAFREIPGSNAACLQ